jgi:hypothetical protein
MDEEAIQRLAKNVVVTFLVDWKDTPEAQVVKRDGAHFLIVKLDSPFSAALHINLEERCEHELKHLYEVVGTEESADDTTDLIYSLVYRLPQELTYITRSVPGLFIYSLHLLDLLAYRERLRSVSESLTQGRRERTELVARILTQGLLLAHGLTERKKPGASSVIDDDKVLDIFLRLQGDVPSIRRLAKELETEPATVRNWLRKKGYNSPKELADDVVNSNSNSKVDFFLKVKRLLTKSQKGTTERKQRGRVEIKP